MTPEEVNKYFQDGHKDYYNKHFAGKIFIEETVLKLLKDCMFKLMAAHISFAMLLNSLKQVEEDTAFYKTYPKEKKETLENITNSLEYITDTIENILQSYVIGMSDDE